MARGASPVPGDNLWIIDISAAEQLHVKLGQFEGALRCDVRMFANYGGRWVSTRAGLNIGIEMVDGLTKALTNAREAALAPSD